MNHNKMHNIARTVACSYLLSIILSIILPILIVFKQLPPYNNLAWMWMILPVFLFSPVLFIFSLCDREFNSEKQEKYNYAGYFIIIISLILIIIISSLLATFLPNKLKIYWLLILLPIIMLYIGYKLIKYKGKSINTIQVVNETNNPIINLSNASIVGEVRSTNIEHTHVIKISNKEINYIGQPEPEP